MRSKIFPGQTVSSQQKVRALAPGGAGAGPASSGSFGSLLSDLGVLAFEQRKELLFLELQLEKLKVTAHLR